MIILGRKSEGTPRSHGIELAREIVETDSVDKGICALALAGHEDMATDGMHADMGQFGDELFKTLPEVMNRVGLSRSAIYKRMSEGRFPRPRSLNVKCAVWIEAEIGGWILDIAGTWPHLTNGRRGEV